MRSCVRHEATPTVVRGLAPGFRPSDFRSRGKRAPLRSSGALASWTMGTRGSRDCCSQRNQQSQPPARPTASLLPWTKLSSGVRAVPTASGAIAMREKRERHAGAGPRRIRLDAAAASEQPTQQTSQAGQYSFEQPENTGEQPADRTTETPEQAHRLAPAPVGTTRGRVRASVESRLSPGSCCRVAGQVAERARNAAGDLVHRAFRRSPSRRLHLSSFVRVGGRCVAASFAGGIVTRCVTRLPSAVRLLNRARRRPSAWASAAARDCEAC